MRWLQQLRGGSFGFGGRLTTKGRFSTCSCNDGAIKLQRELMRKLLKKQGFAPDVLVTDKLRSYGVAPADTTARAQDAAFQIARISSTLLVHSRRRPKHFQRPAPSHIPPHAPRLPRRSFPDVASATAA
jgi:hypothetical protein